MKELERITDQSGVRDHAESTWKVLAPKIIAQARLEDHNKGVKGMYGCTYMCGYVLHMYTCWLCTV